MNGRKCSEHSGVCVEIADIKETGRENAKTLTRIQWLIVSAVVLGAVNLVFQMAGKAAASGH